MDEPSLRIVPVSDGFLLPTEAVDEYRAVLEEFPAYGSVLLRLANHFFNLRTVIVTAAVYWGFGSVLRLR